MAIHFGDKIVEENTTKKVVDNKIIYDNFICKLSNTLSKEGYHVFYAGNVKRFEQNNEFVYLWVDAKGNACYTPSLLDKEYSTTTPTRIGNALSSHFQVSIEVVNNRNEYLRKKTIATMGLNKALSDAQRYDENAAYSNHSFQGEILGEISMNENTNKQGSGLLEDVCMSENINQQMLQHQPVVHQQQYLQQPRYDQEQLNKEIVGLTANQLEYNGQTHYLSINELFKVNKAFL